MEPPPSEAAAKGTIPDDTAAAAPPLEPPALRLVSAGRLTAPCKLESEIFLKPNSGVLVRPKITKPSSSSFLT
ncbi:Uncharacterised protein [Chlamydia trachomatis]|nr:Uncharacterised protein [Chlamydia trachomatis]